MPLSLNPSSPPIQFPRSLHPKTSFGPDSNEPLPFPERLHPKTSFGPDGKKQLSFSINDLQKLFLECRRSGGWATLLSPLLHGSLPTKTSFGTDLKKQLSFPINDLQNLFPGRNKSNEPVF